MVSFEEVVVMVEGLRRRDLYHWVSNRWVLPEQQEGQWRFSAVDVARVRLICELRDDLAIDEEALPVVLSLLDQVYGLRMQMKALCAAIAEQPEPVRQAISAAVRAHAPPAAAPSGAPEDEPERRAGGTRRP